VLGRGNRGRGQADSAVAQDHNTLASTVPANGDVNPYGVAQIKHTSGSLRAGHILVSNFNDAGTDPAALVIGPTGVGLRANCASDSDDCDRDGALLYVADTLSNRIAVIDHPLGRTTSGGIGRTLTSGGSLNGPLGLTVTPAGELLTVNGGDGFITEVSPGGAQVAKMLLDSSGSPPGAGALFGLVFDPAHGVYFVDDATNTLDLLH
jgi:hypothetical protein